MRFHSGMVTLELQKYVVFETEGTENTLLSAASCIFNTFVTPIPLSGKW